MRILLYVSQLVKCAQKTYVLLIFLYVMFPIYGTHISELSYDVVQNICKYIDCWQDINNFGFTCRYFDELVTKFEKPIFVNCCLKRETTQSCNDFLKSIFHLLQRIVQRQGYNPIFLTLAHNELSEDVPAFHNFITSCIESDVKQYLFELNIGMNGIVDLPQNFNQLHALQLLQIHACSYIYGDLGPSLQQEALELISTMTWLQELNISNNKISKLPESFSNLVNLRRCFLSFNNLTAKSLSLCSTFKNLQTLHICGNALTLEAVFRVLPHWPEIKKVEAAYIERGNMGSVEQQVFESISPEVEITVAYHSKYKCHINHAGNLVL